MAMNKTIYEAEFTKMVHDKLREANRLHEYEKISKDKLGGNYWDIYWTIRYMLRTIEDILANGDKLSLNGFFTVAPKLYKERAVRSGMERTGKNVYEIPDRYLPKFKPCARLKRACKLYEDNSESAHKCYDDAEMCQEWQDDPQLFIKQYLELYYEVPGESMAVDKDLFGNGSKVYSPDTICILPQSINTLLANCKKHYKDGETPDNVLPLGVRYNGKINKYYSEITYFGTEDTITLPYRDTIDEAFADYKKFKECDIAITVSKYRDKIPEYIYEKLLTVRVETY